MDGINTVPKETKELCVFVCVRWREKQQKERQSVHSVCLFTLCGKGAAGLQLAVVRVCERRTAVKGMHACLNLVNQAVKAIIRTTSSFLLWQTHTH